MIAKESFEEYKKDTRFISPSDIRGCKTPFHYYYKKFLAKEEEPTESLIIGTAYHCLILEPEDFENRFTVFKKSMIPFPDKDFRNQENKAFKDNFMKEAKEKNKIVLTEEQYNELFAMREELLKKYPDLYEKILNKEYCIFEHDIYNVALFDEFGTLKEFVRLQDKEQINEFQGKRALFLATRPDCINPENLYQFDLKTTIDAYPDNFSREAYNFEYHLQCAMGLDILTCEFGKEFKDFFFLCQEKNEPYMSALFHASDQFIEIGTYQYRLRLKKLLEAIESGVYAGYEINRNYESAVAEAIELYIPRYAENKIPDF